MTVNELELRTVVEPIVGASGTVIAVTAAEADDFVPSPTAFIADTVN